MSRKDYIGEWRANNPDRVAQYNRDYYLRKKEGLVVGKPLGEDKYCPNCNLVFKNVRSSGKFVILSCKCGYKRTFDEKDFYG